jgi:hypothetical protein
MQYALLDYIIDNGDFDIHFFSSIPIAVLFLDVPLAITIMTNG